MDSRRLSSCIGAALISAVLPTAQAQSVKPQEEMRAVVGMHAQLPAPEPVGFGERINPITGELSLLQTEAVLDGAGPALSVSREFVPGNAPAGWPRTGAFADWTLALPRITTLSLAYPDGHGWRVAGPNPFARCTAFGAPAKVAASETTRAGLATVDPNAWWHGYQLDVPGLGQQEVLRRAAGNDLAPDMKQADGSPMTFPLVTANQWQIACVGATANGEPGEGFIAVAPDGTRYTFDHLVYAWAPALDLADTGKVDRVRASLLVTRVEDRFGNTLTYLYEGDRLVGMQRAGDAEIKIDYRADAANLIDRVTLRPEVANPRVWTYRYDQLGTGSERLAGVTHPDGTSWSFELQNLAEARVAYTSDATCDAAGSLAEGRFDGSMVNPEGLSATLTLASTRHWRAGLVSDCKMSVHAPWRPYKFDTLSIVARAYEGAAIAPLSWSYRYSPAASARVWVETVDPDQRVTRTTFSKMADNTEGKPLDVAIDWREGGSFARLTRFSYAAAQAGPYPERLGNSPQTRINTLVGVATPLTKREIVQDGDTFTTEAKAFDRFAQPVHVRRFNSIADQPSLELGLSYLEAVPQWTLGLSASVTDLSSQTPIAKTIYDPANATVAEQWSFGRKLASYTYTSRGQLASVTDGNGLTTRYDGYVLDVPGTIAYPDGTTESRTVDPFGDVVVNTDRAGIITTTEYDAMGRVARIGTPRGDSVAWNDTAIFYDLGPVGAQFGGYASRKITQREGMQENVYYDALGRPALVHLYEWGNSLRHSQRRAYDWHGATIFASYPLEGELHRDAITAGVSTGHDVLGRPIKIARDSELGSLVTDFNYHSGATVLATDPKGAITTTRYQVLDTPDHGGVLDVQAPEGVTQAVVRDAFGLPQSITQSGMHDGVSLAQTRQYIYDDAKRLCRTVDPETQSTVFDYDAGDRLIWSEQGAPIAGEGCGREQVSDPARTRRTYDAMNRLTAVSYPDGSGNTNFRYDPMGRLLQAQSGTTDWSYAYNARGLLTSETLSVEGLAFSLAYGYNANGHLTHTVYPSGRNIDHAPNGIGQATMAGGFASSARYHANGALAYFKYGNGIEYLAEQNARLAPASLSYAKPDGALLFSQDLAYDVNGNLLSSRDLGDGGQRAQEFTYDALNRLASATAPNLWGTETYTYDPFNHIRSIANISGVRAYQYDAASRLISAQGSDGQQHQFGYDGRGNVTQRDSTPLSFDLANRLMEVSGKEAYAYDAFGRRVLKTRLGTGGSKTYYVYNRSGSLLHQRDSDRASSGTDYIALGGTLVAQVATTQADLPGAIWFSSASPTDGPYTVMWGGVSGSVAYELEEQRDASGWAQVYRGSATSAERPGDGGAYDYRVRACRETCADWVISSQIGVRPKRVEVVHVPPGEWQTGPYTVSWDAPIGATAYDIDEGKYDFPMTNWTRVASDVTELSIIRPGDAPGTYYYRIVAKNAHGHGPWSAETNRVGVQSPEQPTVGSITYDTPSPSSGVYSVIWEVNGVTAEVEEQKDGGPWVPITPTSMWVATGFYGIKTPAHPPGTYVYRVRGCAIFNGCFGWLTSSPMVVQ